MTESPVARLRRTLDRWFPERHLYVRSGGDMRSVVLCRRKQMLAAAGVATVLGWAGFATLGAAGGALAVSASEQEAAQLKARYQRLLVDRQARLDQAVAQLSSTRGSVDQLAADVESRHVALARVMAELKDEPGAADALTTDAEPSKPGAAPAERIQRVRLDQESLIAKADDFARTRADRLRLALRMAGASPSRAGRIDANALGGPLIGGRDPRALAAVLDVDEDFARRVQRVSRNLAEMRTLGATADTLPFAKPVESPRLTSGYGVRFDPFTSTPAFHSGQDFAGAHMTSVEATAPGVVSYAGVRSGYGNTVEVDHGGGFKTRYAHLARIGVRAGQRVAVGQALGGMGSTGRSTGTHLHYEVWVNGRAQNPARFLKAGESLLRG